MNDGQQDRNSGFDFDSMNLQVGTRLQLLLTGRGGTPVSYFTTLIGYIKDEYLIVKTPLESGAPLTLRDGEQVTIRAFSGVNVCAFSVKIERLFLQPLFYVHLAFPKKIQVTSLRQAMRVRVNISGTLAAVGAASEPLPVMLSNLSVAGALVESERELENADGPIELSFTLTTQPGNRETAIVAPGMIRNLKRQQGSLPDQEIFVYGVEFIDLDPTNQIMLQNLTYEALIGDRQKII